MVLLLERFDRCFIIRNRSLERGREREKVTKLSFEDMAFRFMFCCGKGLDRYAFTHQLHFLESKATNCC